MEFPVVCAPYPKTILLVEDEAVIAMTETAMLTKNGYNVLTAYNAEKAIKSVRENDIDLILMDIDLGEGKMDGTEAAEIILQEREVPVVFLSSHTEPEVVDRTEKITSYGYIVKNSGDTVLLASIKMAFRLFEANQRIKKHEEDLIGEKEKLQHYIGVIEERQRLDNEKQNYLMQLYDKMDLPREKLFDFVLDSSIRVTNSEYGFSGFINEDESVMTIHRWSKNAMEECTVADRPIEFSIDKAGIWGDCIRERKPVIINDYKNTNRRTKHGTPPGHVEVKRFLCVPIFVGEKIVAVGAVANKGIPYDTADVDALTLLYDKMWSLFEKQEQEKKLGESEARFHQLFNTMKEGVAIYRAVDDGEDFVFVNLNNAGLSYGNKKREEVIGRRITEVYPGVKEIGLLAALRQVYGTGVPRHLPLVRYKDERVEEWVENYVFKLPSGLIVAVYEDTTERHEEEQRYKTIVQTTMDGFWLFDESGDLVDVNDAYCRMSGYTRQELLQMAVPQLDALESKEDFNRHLQQVIKEGYGRFESVHQKKDGSCFPVDICVTRIPFIKEGQFIVFIRDISEGKQLEAVLQESEQKFRSVFEESPIGKALYNARGELIEMNYACMEIFGVTDVDQLKEFNLFDDPNVTNEQKEKLRNGEKIRFKKHFDFEKVKAAELYATVKSDPIYLDTLMTPLIKKEENEIRGYLVQVIDITEQKELEKTLEEDAFRLSAIVAGTNVGTWEWNVRTGETRFNEMWANIIGYSLEDLSPVTIETWKNHAHPDDFKVSEKLLKKHFNGEAEYYECEARMKHKNGNWVWVLDRGKVATWTENGEPEWMYGTHQSITDRKQLEQELQENEQKWRSLVENNPDFIAIHDEEGRFLYLNRYAEGFSEDDVLGTSAYEYMSEESKELFRQKEKVCLETWTVQKFEHHAAGDGGMFSWYENYLVPFVEKGNEKRVIVVSRDITDRKQAEKALIESEKKLQKSEAYYNNVLQFIPVFVLDTEFRYLNVNENAAELVHMGVEDLRGKKITDLFPGFEETEYYKIYKRVMESRKAEILEADFVLPDGSTGCYQCNVLPCPEGIQCIATDISDLKRNERKLKSLLEERDMLRKEMHHRVKNNLMMIISLINLKANELEGKDRLLDLKNQIEAIRLVQDQLHETGQRNSIDLKSYVESIVHSVLDFTPAPVDIDINTEIGSLHSRTAMSIGLIINETATNAVKHGFSGREGERFTVDLKEDKSEGQYVLNLSNTGKPFPEGVGLVNPNTLGLQLITALVGQLEGTIELRRGPHPRFIIRFPMGKE